MRSIAKLAFVIPAFLLIMNSASAAFIFSFSTLNPTNPPAAFGASGSFDIRAQYSNFDGGTNSLTSLNVPLTSNNANFTVSTTLLGPGALAGFGNGETRTVGTVNWTHVGPGSTTLVNFGTITAGGPGLILTVPGAVTLTAVPEPSSFALLGVAGLGYVAYRRRRKTAKV